MSEKKEYIVLVVMSNGDQVLASVVGAESRADAATRLQREHLTLAQLERVTDVFAIERDEMYWEEKVTV